MGVKLMLRQSYRLFVAVIAGWGVWTLLWGSGPISMSASAIGYGWLALAAIGAILALSLYSKNEQAFSGSQRARSRFKNHSLSSTPLLAYAALVVVWSLAFAGWFTGTIGISSTVVGYGWYAIAAYGGVLTIGLVVKHTTVLSKAVSPSASVDGS